MNERTVVRGGPDEPTLTQRGHRVDGQLVITSTGEWFYLRGRNYTGGRLQSYGAQGPLSREDVVRYGPMKPLVRREVASVSGVRDTEALRSTNSTLPSSAENLVTQQGVS